METIEIPTQTAFEIILQTAGGFCVPKSLHLVAELGVADQINDLPRSAREIAKALDVNSDALQRVLTLLAAHGIFEECEGGFQHSAASRLLRTDHPQSLRVFARMFGLPVFWRTFEEMEHSLRYGTPAAEKVLPEGFWNYLSQHPKESEIFNATMTAKAVGQIEGVLDAYDFSPFNVIADIAGGRGHLLARILQTYPNAKGVLFDLPAVIGEVQHLKSDRLTLQTGDFFKDTLPPADLYILMEIIHDWSDERSIQILNAVKSAAKQGAKVLLIEQLITPNKGPQWAKMLDIIMLTMLGGRQRTVEQYSALLSKSGITFEREIPTMAGVSLIEGVIA